MDEPRLFADDPTTPMMEQYFRIKSAHPDALLFFRLGDFYEMFYEDAAIGSRVLEIALTSRQKVPMCEELLDIIEAKGREINEALSVLRNIKS